MVAMVKSPEVFSDRAHRGLDGDLQDEGRWPLQPSGPQRSGGRRAKAFLPREE
jgi:hypothetical protein